MKKVLFILFFATLSLGSYAQKGMQGVGLSVDPGVINCYFEETYPITTLKYQYYIHDNIRVVPSLMMGVSDWGEFDKPQGFNINPYIKADVFLTPISKFRVYASAGIGYAYVYVDDEYYENIGRFEYKKDGNYYSLLLGIGVEWRVAYNWTIQLSGNFDGLAGTYTYKRGSHDYIGDYIGFGGHLSLGFVYNF